MLARILALLTLLTLCASLRAAAPDSPTVIAKVTPDKVQLDGHLDEPAWRSVTPEAILVQQSPEPGQPTPYDTRVTVLITGDTLYFGFDCKDPDPRGIAIHTMQRDGFMMGDDNVTIALDSYGDRRTGYFFQINAAGARVDGLIADPENASLDWDGVWDARTAKTVDGWTAEIEIPSRSLNFTPGLQRWGLNLERFVARKRVTLRWSSPTLDSFITDLSRAGNLKGVASLEQGRGLEVAPYAIGKMSGEFRGSDRVWQGTEGLDFTWRITPQLASVFTINTDFAETEVDARQINLTRFPLFFPEKRAFFLEGANQFEFGLSLGETFIPFFSRRVGLLEGQQVPLGGGLKLNGRMGKWNLAVLDVQTRDTPLAPGTNLFAGRASYDVNSQLRVGSIVTHGDPNGLDQNTLTGVDAVWRTSEFRGNKNLQIGAFAAMASGDVPDGDRGGWGFKVDYPNDFLDCFTIMNRFGEALDPALGFLPRPGTRQYRGGCSIKPRPRKDSRFGWIRQAYFRSYYTRFTNLDGVNESWEYTLTPVEFQLESGETFSLTYSPQYEFLPEPFEISDGVTLPLGGYRFNRVQIEAETSEHRPWQIETEIGLGSFYNGHLTQWASQLSWTSNEGRWQFRLEVENNFATLAQGNFVQRLWQPQIAFAWNPNIVLTSFVQYDTESQNLGTNTRLRWTFSPGRDLFVVWNRGWQRLLPSRDLSLLPENEMLAIKLRWTFRM
ncbi:MAG: hypothetical protein EHM61_00190 [Acidobacteria bacterium]|nr:MAG: hypothetical protein EHM61_00190 [Acidobacteriota bacterium]